jgi:hypothetical protein
MNPFKKIVSGLVWLGKEVAKPFVEAKKIITIVPELEQDAQSLLPEAIAVIDDAGSLSVAAVKDGGEMVTLLEAAITDAETGNVTGALASAEQLFSDVTHLATFKDVVTKWKQLVVDYDKLGADGEAALKRVEAQL